MEPDALRQKRWCHKQKIHQTNRRQNTSGNREVEKPECWHSAFQQRPIDERIGARADQGRHSAQDSLIAQRYHDIPDMHA